MTLWYLLLTLFFSIFIPEAGGDIANSINNALNADISGFAIWIIGLVIAIIAD